VVAILSNCVSLTVSQRSCSVGWWLSKNLIDADSPRGASLLGAGILSAVRGLLSQARLALHMPMSFTKLSFPKQTAKPYISYTKTPNAPIFGEVELEYACSTMVGVLGTNGRHHTRTLGQIIYIMRLSRPYSRVVSFASCSVLALS
jgi:hypothetical protein